MNDQHNREMTQMWERLEAIQEQIHHIPRLGEAVENADKRITRIEQAIHNGISEEVASQGKNLEFIAERKATERTKEVEEKLGEHLDSIHSTLREQLASNREALEKQQRGLEKQQDSLKAKQRSNTYMLVSIGLMVVGFLVGKVLGIL